jgi:D-aminopeptidase
MLDGLFEAVADATEEAILNALCAAETMTGFKGRTAYAMPLEQVVEAVLGGREPGR